MSKKTARGVKRRCRNQECGLPFYDLDRAEVACPMCGAAFDMTAASHPAAQPGTTPWGGRKHRPAPRPIAAPTFTDPLPGDPEEAPESGDVVGEVEEATDSDAPVTDGEPLLEQQDDDPVTEIDELPIEKEPD
jgi:hypothetical protein